MKLAALFCVAALGLTGCLDEPSGGGGHQAGMRPAKPSLDNPDNSRTPINPEVFEGMNMDSSIRLPDVPVDGAYAEVIKPPVPMPGVCDECEVIAFRNVDEDTGIGEISVFSDGGVLLCKIFLSDDGVIVDECGWHR